MHEVMYYRYYRRYTRKQLLAMPKEKLHVLNQALITGRLHFILGAPKLSEYGLQEDAFTGELVIWGNP